MFHYRWAREVDQLSSAGRLARAMMPAADDEQHAAMTAQVRERMVDRVWFVGSNAQTAPQIEASFREALALLDAHLADAPVSVRRAAGLRRLRRCGDSSTTRGPIPRRAR